MKKHLTVHYFRMGGGVQHVYHTTHHTPVEISVEKKAAQSTPTQCKTSHSMPPVVPVASVHAALDSVCGVGTVLRVGAPRARDQILTQSSLWNTLRCLKQCRQQRTDVLRSAAKTDQLKHATTVSQQRLKTFLYIVSNA